MPSLLAVCRVHELHDDKGSVGITAIDKRPIDGPVRVGEYGLYRDVQADRKHHGGPTKAVYAYSQEDADWWSENLGRPIENGLFGENLRTRGLDVSGAVIGERWRIGAEVELEVASPRTPCATFGRRMKELAWVRRFTTANRPGAYLRVIRQGEIAAGDEIQVISRPEHGVTISAWFGFRRAADAEALMAAHVAGTHPLVPEMLDSLDLAIASGR